MKQLLLSICIAFLLVSKVNAQAKSEEITTNTVTAATPERGNKISDDNTIYISAAVDVQPEFAGGMPKWYSFLQENFKAPNVPGLNGKVILSFVVEKDGSIVDIKVLRDIGYGTGDEAVRIMKLSPNWSPAQQNGAAVRCSFVQTITIAIPVTAVEPINETKSTEDNSLFKYEEVAVQPGFPGGLSNWYSFLRKNFRSPEEPGLKGEIVVSFIVERDGSLADFKVLKAIGFGTADEAVRVLKLSPKWEPAQKGNKPVRCAYIQTFKIETPVGY